MTNLKLTPYWGIYADLVTFMKECLPVEGNDAYWKRVSERASQICDLYQNTDQKEFVESEMNSIFDELNRICKRGETNEAVQ